MLVKIKKSKLISLYRNVFKGNHTMGMRAKVQAGMPAYTAFMPPIARQVKKIMAILNKNAGRQFHSEEVDRIILGMIKTLEKSRTIKLI